MNFDATHMSVVVAYNGDLDGDSLKTHTRLVCAYCRGFTLNLLHISQSFETHFGLLQLQGEFYILALA